MEQYGENDIASEFLQVSELDRSIRRGNPRPGKQRSKKRSHGALITTPNLNQMILQRTRSPKAEEQSKRFDRVKEKRA